MKKLGMPLAQGDTKIGVIIYTSVMKCLKKTNGVGTNGIKFLIN